MQPPAYIKTVDSLRLFYTGEAAIEYRLRIYEPQDQDAPPVVICTYDGSQDLAPALLAQVLAETRQRGPWLWVHQQSAPVRHDAPAREAPLRLLVLVRNTSGLPEPYSRTWTPTNRAWLERLLAQTLEPPEGWTQLSGRAMAIQRGATPAPDVSRN